MLTLLAKLFKALNSESSPRQIAFAIALGMIVGLTPTFSMHNLLVLFIAFIIRINLSAFFLGFAVFSLLSIPFASTFAGVGEQLLTNESLQALWQSLYQSSLLKLAHFHNTLTLGALVVALVLLIPVTILGQYLVVRYRNHVKTFIEKFKIVQLIKGSKFYKIYQGLTGTGV